MTTPNAVDCIGYIEEELHFPLYKFQKKLITAWFAGKRVATSRCIGRTTCKNLVRAYLDYWADTLDYNSTPQCPDMKITYKEALDEHANICSQETIDWLKEWSPEIFEKEMELEYESYKDVLDRIKNFSIDRNEKRQNSFKTQGEIQ